MNNQGLLALAQLILPSEILSNFEVVRVEEEASLIRIYLDESVKAEYKENPEIESKGFCEAVTIRDFPIRDKGVDLIVRRRKWYDKQNNRYFSDFYDLAIVNGQNSHMQKTGLSFQRTLVKASALTKRLQATVSCTL